MARIRSIHPSLFTDEAWVSCSPLARILYVGLMTDADDQGLFEWKTLQIKMRLLPADNVDVAQLLAELVAANLIASLESGGKKLGAIRYFRRFQRPKKPNSIFLLPPEWRTYVGLEGGSSEPEADDEAEVPNQFGTGGENPPQMEDGGWRMEEEEVGTLSLVPTSQPNPEASVRRAAAKERRGSRLPADWSPTSADIAYAIREHEFSQREIDRLGEAFRDHWHAATGQKAVKLDWSAAWRTWCRNERTFRPKAAQSRKAASGVW